jgi:hypothetical protein
VFDLYSNMHFQNLLIPFNFIMNLISVCYCCFHTHSETVLNDLYCYIVALLVILVLYHLLSIFTPKLIPLLAYMRISAL